MILSNEDSKELASGISALKSLRSLTLRHMWCGGGCSTLAAALEQLPMLQAVDLSHNDLRVLDVLELAQALSCLPALHQLTMFLNRLDKDDELLVLATLRSCHQLNVVQLGLQIPSTQCPCCDYFAINCDECACILDCCPVTCHVCGWLYGGHGGSAVDAVDEYYFANRTTVRQARQLFQQTCASGTVQYQCSQDEVKRYKMKAREFLGDQGEGRPIVSANQGRRPGRGRGRGRVLFLSLIHI